mmetsp:Transcript_27410/g.91683  ORF Transcript_27410/g.91683 Transcript_27410/m.91683 type:complete len:170 (-) Transcript_27410:295-804(-)
MAVPVPSAEVGAYHEAPSVLHQVAQIILGIMISIMLLTLLVLWISYHVAGDELAVVPAADPDASARQALAAEVLTLSPQQLDTVRTSIDRQRALQGAAGGAVWLPPGDVRGSQWTVHRAPDGRRYYLNAADGTTTWDTPAELAGTVSWDHRKHAADRAGASSSVVQSFP